MVFGLSAIYTERGLTQRLTMLLIEYVFTHSGPKADAIRRQKLAQSCLAMLAGNISSTVH
ncbi:hypothetical protein CCL08_14320 [Pseudomonas congelans]|uniref:Uncharacterized protein n=1 Tax=Pseudomonas syringae pv. syringae TaxID=321 RepID=A0AAE5VWL6_PSESY|nr:hypothetical protein CCL08_14320 [Pseudomonas congelans]POQ06092.1 hypothetical protein CXB42_01300 [Pseudomonas syringae pv. syringae]